MALDPQKLRAKIESIGDLPTLPTVVTKIVGQLNNPSTNAADIGKLIEQDPALSGKVLRLVNSAYYGFPRQIKSIQSAVVILGFNKIRTTIMTASLFSSFRKGPAGFLNINRFWQHSLGAAMGAKSAAETLGSVHLAEDAFIGGLLHDVGKIIMDQYQPAIFGPILKYAADKGMLVTEVENQVMNGFNHAAIGSWLVENWRLPKDIVRMVEGHHSPQRYNQDRELVAFVHIGDILARAIGVGNGGDNRMPALNSEIVANFQLNEVFFEKSVTKLIREIEKASEFFSMLTI
ncbi:MAG: HDOD domain-containing protein [Planctomycetota bacterium]|jgi:putative nucleotidyltransferase with HDIG domain|nr:HDOD domain-containing protein [Planctomycetota bacterium]